MSELNFISVGSTTPKTTVIVLHGLGASGYDFEDLAIQWSNHLSNETRFLLPHAPMRSISVNGGMSMPAWYDICRMEQNDSCAKQGLEESTLLIQQLIEQEVHSPKIILAGFSQGGALSLHIGLRSKNNFDGILCMSGYLASELPSEDTLKQFSANLLMMHGTLDPVVPIQLAKNSFAQMKDNNIAGTWKEYSMPHSLCEEQISDIQDWLDFLS